MEITIDKLSECRVDLVEGDNQTYYNNILTKGHTSQWGNKLFKSSESVGYMSFAVEYDGTAEDDDQPAEWLTIVTITASRSANWTVDESLHSVDSLKIKPITTKELDEQRRPIRWLDRIKNIWRK